MDKKILTGFIAGIITALFITAITLLFVFSMHDQKQEPKANDVEPDISEIRNDEEPNLSKISLAINTFPNSALVHIAQEKGYFIQEGLDVKYHAFPTGKIALDAMIGGGADIATTADVPIALAGLAEQKISVIATIEYSNDNIQVVARSDRGITSPADLKGKKISTTKGGGPLFFTHKFLEKYDIDLSDIELVYLTPHEMLTALIRGDIDALIVFEPFPYMARKELGAENTIVFIGQELYGETWNIVVRKDFESENPQKVKSFLKALSKADTFLKENPQESLNIVAEYSETDTETLSEMMKRQTYGLVLNELLTDYLYQEAEWAIRQGLTSKKNIPDYDSMINRDFLNEINPEGVTI
ncbi:ABC transporter substrate-binding protein [Thermoproteota archaeon]